MTSTFDQAKIRYLTSQWISTSPVSRHYPRHSFPPIISFLHPAPPLWSLVRPKLATSGWGGQTGAMLFSQTLPVKNVVLRSWAVVNPSFSEAFWGTWWRQIKALKSLLSCMKIVISEFKYCYLFLASLNLTSYQNTPEFLPNRWFHIFRPFLTNDSLFERWIRESDFLQEFESWKLMIKNNNKNRILPFFSLALLLESSKLPSKIQIFKIICWSELHANDTL